MTKAIAQEFTYAGIQIEGLLMPDNTYRIAVSQVAKSLFPATPNNATKYVKAALGNGLTATPILKVSSDLNSQKVNTITFDQFSDVVYYYAVEKGNETAKTLLKVSVKLSITQAFEVALGIEKTNREQAISFEEMVESKTVRLSTTDCFKKVYEETGCFPKYGTHTLMLYEALDLLDHYNAWKKTYNKSQRQSITFRHNYLSHKDRRRVTLAENNLVFMVMKLGMTVEEAISKI